MELGVVALTESQEQDGVKSALRNTLSTVYLGDVIDIWQDHRQICVGSHAEFAKHLLAVHKEYCLDYCRAESQEKAAVLSVYPDNEYAQQANNCGLFHDGSKIEDTHLVDNGSAPDTPDEEETDKTMDATQEVDGVDVKPRVGLSEVHKTKMTSGSDEGEKSTIGPGDDMVSGQLEILNVYTRTQAIAMPFIGTRDTVTIKEDVDEDTQDLRVESAKSLETDASIQTFAGVKHFGKLNRQMTHTGESPHVCSECGKGFSLPATLKRHLTTHCGERPHVCSDCGKGFSEVRTLKQHMTSHTGQKPHVCLDCGRRFTRGYELKIHMRIHTGEKPHTCPHCGVGFSRLHQLKVHKITHTGQMPHICSTCGKGFSTNQTLKRHLMIHTGEKPHACSECGKRFNMIGNMRTHVKKHGNEAASVN